MKIKFWGDIDHKVIKTESADIYDLFDPNGILAVDEKGVIVTVEIKMSKQGNLVALVKDKSKI